jgi:hypothetical protein
MDSTGITTRDPQRQQANQNLDQITLRLRSAIQETFTTLVYPSMGQLRTTDCRINFQNNQFDGEKLIRDTLTNAKKFETETSTDAFRRKCEERLFQGQKTAKWSEIKRRAAMSDAWPLHRADALDALKTRAINEGLGVIWATRSKKVRSRRPGPKCRCGCYRVTTRPARLSSRSPRSMATRSITKSAIRSRPAGRSRSARPKAVTTTSARGN